MHQNVSLGSNGSDRVLSSRKIPMRLRGMKFCTSSARSAPSFIRQPNSPKCTKIVQIARKQKFSVQWGGSGEFVAKNSNATLWHEVFHQFDPFYTKCCYATKLSQMHPNNTKHTKKHEFRVHWGGSGVFV